ncbi:type VII secretion protein EccB [Gordonia phosphorivorans]|uniref:Type VII secretion protein EccB n=1 Tax=Gordonia phosphorivorans TaxID=1056982 RepID=A0ABV6H8F0_9ACTN
MTTRAQVSGYRFGVARAEHALVRRDARMLDDPMRAQFRALLAGAVVAVLLAAGAGIYGLISPAPSVAEAKIIASDTGGLYVLVDDVMHPVPNLASARLVVGEPLSARTVSHGAVSRYPRGSALGIAGAPAALPGPDRRESSTWSVCDDPAAGTAVIAGSLTAEAAPSAAGALVRSPAGEWLIYHPGGEGRRRPVRARVQGTATAVRRALGLDGATARPISQALLNAFPAEPELAVPEIAGRGGPGPGALADVPVGTVIRSLGVDDRPSYFVVLADGVQPVSVAAAEAVRGADRDSAGAVRQVSPGAMSAVPVVHRVPLDHFPAGPVTLAGASTVLCRRWEYAAGAAAARETWTITPHLPLPSGARVVPLRAGDGTGPALDGAYLRPGTAERVQIAGAEYYVTDAGVRYRLVGEDTAAMLGLPAAGRPAPWPVLSLLPSGPTLAREAALVARDLPR